MLSCLHHISTIFQRKTITSIRFGIFFSKQLICSLILKLTDWNFRQHMPPFHPAWRSGSRCSGLLPDLAGTSRAFRCLRPNCFEQTRIQSKERRLSFWWRLWSLQLCPWERVCCPVEACQFQLDTKTQSHKHEYQEVR